MDTEAKAKVVASVFYINFFAALAVLASVDLKEQDEFNLFFKIDRGKTASEARN